MGWKLANNVLDNAPADLSPAERLVADVIAWAVLDDTGQGGLEEEKLLRRTGLSPQGLASALRRLRDRGFELRVPTGIGKDGRPTYAHRGLGRTYRIPESWRHAFKRPPQEQTNGSEEWPPRQEAIDEERPPAQEQRPPQEERKASSGGDPGVFEVFRSQHASTDGVRAREIPKQRNLRLTKLRNLTKQLDPDRTYSAAVQRCQQEADLGQGAYGVARAELGKDATAQQIIIRAAELLDQGAA